MEQWILLLIWVVLLFMGSYLLGILPLKLSSSSKTINLISVFGAGLLVGVSLAIIIPEGVKAIYMEAFILHKGSVRSFQDLGIYIYI